MSGPGHIARLIRSVFRRSPVAAGLAVAGVLLVGCGGSGHHRTATSAITRAAAASVASGLQMQISLDETVGGPSVVFTANGSFSPKLGAGTMTMDMRVPPAGGPTTPMLIVIAKGTIYERLPPPLAGRIPGGRPWLSLRISRLGTLDQMPGLYAFIRESLTFANPKQYLDFVEAAAVGSGRRIGAAKVNGLPTTQYRTSVEISKLPRTTATVDRAAARQLASVLRSRFQTSAMPVEVWIDRSHRIRRLRTALNGTFAGHPVSVAITANITHYGTPPTPTAPPPSQTTNLLSLVHGL